MHVRHEKFGQTERPMRGCLDRALHEQEARPQPSEFHQSGEVIDPQLNDPATLTIGVRLTMLAWRTKPVPHVDDRGGSSKRGPVRPERLTLHSELIEPRRWQTAFRLLGDARCA